MQGSLVQQISSKYYLLQPLSITLRGITNDAVDPGVDVWQQVTLPLIRQLAGIEKDGLQMKVRDWLFMSWNISQTSNRCGESGMRSF